MSITYCSIVFDSALEACSFYINLKSVQKFGKTFKLHKVGFNGEKIKRLRSENPEKIDSEILALELCEKLIGGKTASCQKVFTSFFSYDYAPIEKAIDAYFLDKTSFLRSSSVRSAYSEEELIEKLAGSQWEGHVSLDETSAGIKLQSWIDAYQNKPVVINAIRNGWKKTGSPPYVAKAVYSFEFWQCLFELMPNRKVSENLLKMLEESRKKA